MKPVSVTPASAAGGNIRLSGDKSITHRALILSSISPGKTEIKNFPANEDCLYTLKALQGLGVKIRPAGAGKFIVYGRALRGLIRPKNKIFAGESGTTFRLLSGILAGQNFTVTLTAAKSLARRPMARVNVPLRLMGAKINAKRLPCRQGRQSAKTEEYPPLTIRGGNLKAITYKMPVASAQVKSAILLAALYASGKTKIIEPWQTRDHTERMLRLFKANLTRNKNTISIKGDRELVSPGSIFIPGDISSASFFITAAVLLPGSGLTIENIGLNPTRTGFLKVLKRMGGRIKLKVKSSKFKVQEPFGEINVRYSRLRGTVIRAKEIPSLIDELPILMVAAALAKGKTIFQAIGELRLKETDRIRSMSENLRKMGVRIQLEVKNRAENMVITGTKQLVGAKVKSFGDHRTAMSMAIAGLVAAGKSSIDDVACISKSFPDFIAVLRKIVH